jgi:Arf-GAP domain and FG repeats-containing protein 1
MHKLNKNKTPVEDKTVKLIRELASLIYNKQCSECHQKGPTYVNITIGTFVCTTCSGILRGLNPPHRLKSINMATFTMDEVTFIREHGNNYCNIAYMSLYDKTTGVPPDSKDIDKLRDFLSQKYERKRWYVKPTEEAMNRIKEENEKVKTIQPVTQSKIVLKMNRQKSDEPIINSNNLNGDYNKTSSVSSSSNHIGFQLTNPSQSKLNKPIQITATVPTPKKVTTTDTKSVDLFELDNFEAASSTAVYSKTPTTPTPPPTTTTTTSSSQNNFANFDFFQNENHNDTNFSTNKSPIIPNLTATPPKIQISSAVPNNSTNINSNGQTATDRYTALAELDNMFHTTHISSNSLSSSLSSSSSAVSSNNNYSKPTIKPIINTNSSFESNQPVIHNPFIQTDNQQQWASVNNQQPSHNHQFANSFINNNQMNTFNFDIFSKTASSSSSSNNFSSSMANNPFMVKKKLN